MVVETLVVEVLALVETFEEMMVVRMS